MTDYLARLNPEQRAAVETVDGPLLVLAGAGTGKTRVLTTRFAHILLTRRAFPNQVLAVTFTNKAAREMRERVGAILGQPAEGLWLGTFHALCARMLRRHAQLAGLQSNFTILDTDDQLRLLKQVMEAGRVDPKRWAPQRADGGDPALEGPRADPGPGDAGGGHGFRRRAGPRAVCRLPGAAGRAERGRFRRPAAARDGDAARAPRGAGAVSPHVPLHPGRRVPGHQRGAVPVAAAAGAGAQQHLLRGRRRPVDLLVAGRRGGEHPALREGFPRRPDRAAGEQLPLHRADPGRGLRPDRA